MARTNKSGLYRRPGAAIWQIDKIFKGQRLCCSSETTDRKEAEAVLARWIAEQTLKKPGSDKPVMTIKEAAARYFNERGRQAKSSDQINFQLSWIVTELGASKLLSELTENDLLDLGAKRRAQGRLGSDKQWRPCTESTTRRSVYEPLRTVLRRALIVWKVDTAVINWAEIMPKRSRKGRATREVSAAREQELLMALRSDLRDVVEFDFVHGARCGALQALEWDHVDTATLIMKVRRKTTEPGIHYQEIPLIEETATIIERQRGHHQKYVFTYKVKRAHWADGNFVRKGERRPLTKSVMRQVKKAAKKIGMDDFRLHDMRHTAANRALRECGNLEIVRQLLGHSDIATTAIYTGVMTEEVRGALRKSRRSPNGAAADAAQPIENPDENLPGTPRPERGALPG